MATVDQYNLTAAKYIHVHGYLLDIEVAGAEASFLHLIFLQEAR